jgi:hypothetical protein
MSEKQGPAPDDIAEAQRAISIIYASASPNPGSCAVLARFVARAATDRETIGRMEKEAAELREAIIPFLPGRICIYDNSCLDSGREPRCAVCEIYHVWLRGEAAALPSEEKGGTNG